MNLVWLYLKCDIQLLLHHSALVGIRERQHPVQLRCLRFQVRSRQYEDIDNCTPSST